MAMKWKREPAPDDPRLKGHETDYQASRGGWLTKPKPTPKEKK